MATLAEQAREECRREIKAACRIALDDETLDKFMDRFSGNFTRLCSDDPAGQKFWARVGQNMRDNGRYIGTFADFFSRNRRPAPKVTLDDLNLGLIMVRALCFDQQIVPGPTSKLPLASPRFEICEGVMLDPDLDTMWRQFLTSAHIEH